MELKTKERALLRYFRNNAREALTKISRKTGMPVSTIFDKLRKYEATIIQKHTSLLNFEELGYRVRAQLFVKTLPENRRTLGAYLKEYPNVNTIYRINNGFDYLVEVVFHSVQELEGFVEELELERGVKEKELYFIIADVAREQFLARARPC
ncbi:Lrp/AsnC family transcriptional regulator [Candidatus Woesearchaeota archaeon]|nr:Lrp/AsnC family transcriptional regulator [Candidatus Woesearchaeota archaeon]